MFTVLRFTFPVSRNLTHCSGRTRATVRLPIAPPLYVSDQVISGSGGQPYSTFRYMQDIMYVKHVGRIFRVGLIHTL